MQQLMTAKVHGAKFSRNYSTCWLTKYRRSHKQRLQHYITTRHNASPWLSRRSRPCTAHQTWPPNIPQYPRHKHKHQQRVRGCIWQFNKQCSVRSSGICQTRIQAKVLLKIYITPHQHNSTHTLILTYISYHKQLNFHTSTYICSKHYLYNLYTFSRSCVYVIFGLLNRYVCYCVLYYIFGISFIIVSFSHNI